MEPLITCLWFDGQARQAARFYVELLGGELGTESGGDPAHPGEPLTVEFTVRGQKFVGLNGGPQFHFSEATSLQIMTETQEETDHYWDALVADGGRESQCGWCVDRFGFSWQVVPRPAMALLSGPDPESAARVMKAFMGMTRLVISELEAAAAR